MKIVISHSDCDDAAKKAVQDEIKRQGYTMQTHKMGIKNGQIIVMEKTDEEMQSHREGHPSNEKESDKGNAA